MTRQLEFIGLVGASFLHWKTPVSNDGDGARHKADQKQTHCDIR